MNISQEIIADELNVKEVKFADDVRNPSLPTASNHSFVQLDRNMASCLAESVQALAEIDGNEAMNDLKANGVLVL